MKISEDMLGAAIRKGVEAGIFARHSSDHELRIDREVMLAILRSALAVSEDDFPPEPDEQPANDRGV